VIRRAMRHFEARWQDLIRFKLTAPGVSLLVAVAVAAMAASATFMVGTYYVFFSLLGLYVAAYLAAYAMAWRVAVRAELPDRAAAGEPVELRFRLRNTSRLPAYDVSAGVFGLPRDLSAVEPAQTLPALAPGAEGHVEMRLLPLRRGLYDLGRARAYTTFPFGLRRRQLGAGPRGSLLVLPGFHPLSHVDVPVGSRYQPGGIALTSRVGESPEYVGNRDYRPGDSTRHLDFRSWARLARPVVKEFQEEYYCRVALVVDTFIPRRRRPPPGGWPQLEAVVSLSAAVADAMSRGEYLIDIFAAGPQLYVFRGGRHTAHFDSILEILACVDACRTDPFETLAPALAEELPNLSTVICVLTDWDQPRRELVRSAVEAGADVKLVVVRDGPTRLPVEAETAWAGEVNVLAPRDVLRGAVEAL